jgi:large subunit ribosomal protein L7Ae
MLCNEKKIHFVKISTKKDLGAAAGLDVPTAAIAVMDEGNAKKQMNEIIGKKK